MRGRKLSYDPLGWDEAIWKVGLVDAEYEVVRKRAYSRRSNASFERNESSCSSPGWPYVGLVCR